MKRIPIRIEGDWQSVTYPGQLIWQGIARADERITALALCRSPTGIEWVRCGRSHYNEIRITLSARMVETQPDLHQAVVGLNMQPVALAQGHGLAVLQTGAVQTSISPFQLLLDHVETGHPAWFARLRAAKDRAMGALFVCESDTRSVRNGLWHLRKGIEATSVELSAVLDYGRTGTLR